MLLDAQVPAGNVLVTSSEANRFRIRPDLRDTEGPWFYWRFRVRRTDADPRQVDIAFDAPNQLSVLGPAVSDDGGASWHWLDDYDPAGDGFRYTFSDDCREAQFCTSIPYLPGDLESFLLSHPAADIIRREELCRSRRDRSVPILRLGEPDADYRIILTSRHHCCEMIATHCLEGFLNAVISRKNDTLGRLAANCDILAVPFVDFDGSLDGDQGKNRRPHDHNRDYGEAPIYPETRAIMERVAALPPAKKTIFLDLHCPWIRGMWNEHIYIVGSADPINWRRQQEFARLLADAGTGELPYDAAGSLPFGQAWNTTDAGLVTSSARWMASREQIDLAASIEIPYASVSGVTVTATNARDFGRDLAVASGHYVNAIE